MLDGRKLAARITELLDAVATYQRAGKVVEFWPYFKASVERYVGANAEELKEDAMRAGSQVNQCSHHSWGWPSGKFQMELPAVAQDEGEEAEFSAGIAHADTAGRAPVDLRALAGREAQREEGFRARGADLAHVDFEDGVASVVALLAQPGKELRGAVGVRAQEALDRGLEGVELARPGGRGGRGPGFVAGAFFPLGRGLPVHAESAGDLGDRQALLVAQVAGRVALRGRSSTRR